MNLQPAVAVEHFALRHREGLGAIHRELMDVVPLAFAMFEKLHPDGRIHGGVLSAVVRDALLVKLDSLQMRMGDLHAVEGQFRSVRFADDEAPGCRVHMHPRNLTTREYLATTPVEEPLFGPTDVEFDLAVLWRPSVRSKSLYSATLAAVANLDDRKLTTIYASAALPPISTADYWEPNVMEAYDQPIDDFDDFLEGDEGLGDQGS